VSVACLNLRSREQGTLGTELRRRHMHDPATATPNKRYITTTSATKPPLCAVFPSVIHTLTSSRFVAQLDRYDWCATTYILSLLLVTRTSITIAMSGLEIYGAITTTIALLETCKKIYDTAHNAKGLPDAFARVAENIPIVRTVLINIQQGLEARLQAVKRPTDTVNKQELEDAINSVQSIVKTCHENAENLHIIFEKVTSADDTSWLKRYKAAIRTLKHGQQEKVESLMKEILEKLDLLHKEDYFQNAVQSADLKAAIKLLEEVDASLPEQSGMNIYNYGSGPQNSNVSTGTQNNNTISGSNGSQTINYGRS
jgi:hypothetical protein